MMRLLAALALTTAHLAAPPEPLPPARPYLQDAKPGETTLVWRSNPPLAARVEWWTDDGPGTVHVARDGADYQHEVTLGGLIPGAHYAYRVRSGDKVWLGSFRALRGPKATSLRFAAIGDMGQGNAEQRAIAQQLAAWAPELVLAVGDIVYPDGAAADYGKKFFQPYSALLGKACVFPAIGNHDVRSADAEPYLRAFALPRQPGNERWYSVIAGPAQFWVLDSTRPLGPGSPQYAWLEQDLPASAARWKIVAFHHPPFSTGAHGGNGPIRRDLVPLFARLGVDLVVNGHDHDYERFEPQGKVTYLVTGGGGGMLYRAAGGPLTAAVATKHHFVGLSIAGDWLGLQAIDAEGHVFDAAAIKKHRDRQGAAR